MDDPDSGDDAQGGSNQRESMDVAVETLPDSTSSAPGLAETVRIRSPSHVQEALPGSSDIIADDAASLHLSTDDEGEDDDLTSALKEVFPYSRDGIQLEDMVALSIPASHKCPHYIRSCDIQCPECKNFYPCRICHDLKEKHELDRKAVKRMRCKHCSEEQDIAKDCSKCKKCMGRYYCDKCHFHDHFGTDKRRGVFHCDKCGLCLAGGAENFRHCDTCGACVDKTSTTHVCIENLAEGECPVCLEGLRSSRAGWFQLRCGHPIHSKCYKEYVHYSRQYRCPLCLKTSLDDETWKELNDLIEKEVSEYEMPAEYADRMEDIFCNDCQQYSTVKWHMVAMKCTHCGGYNTRSK